MAKRRAKVAPCGCRGHRLHLALAALALAGQLLVLWALYGHTWVLVLTQ